MSSFDSRGVPLSTSNADSLAAYEIALERLHGHRGDPQAPIDRALASDPGFVMGRGVQAGLLVLADDAPAHRQLADVIHAAHVAETRMLDRERRHLAAARAALQRNPRRAARLYGDLVLDYPRDILALQLAHSFDFHFGRRELLRDRVARVLPFWDCSVPGYGSVLAMLAFGHEENGEYARAKTVARAALEHAPGHPGAIHAIAHVMEMQGRPADGDAWLEATAPDWAEGTSFSVHNAWHLALCHVDLDESARALAIYDARIAPDTDPSASRLIDAAALLWRLQLRGVDVHARWLVVANAWEEIVFDQHRVFNQAHAMMAFAAAGRTAVANRVLRALRSGVMNAHGSRDEARSAVIVCEALQAFAGGDYAGTVDRLALVRHLADRCGGSIAQCDVIHLTLVEAALRSRRATLARTLTTERTARRPGSRLNGLLAARAAAALAV